MSSYEEGIDPFRTESDHDHASFADAESAPNTPSITNVNLHNDNDDRAGAQEVSSPSQANYNGRSNSTGFTATSPEPPTLPSRNSFPYRPSDGSAYKSEVEKYIQSAEEVEILITDALKTSENSSSPYIVYVIKTGYIETRRRYSDFESFRNGLVKLYPTIIIPPIPSKQSIGEYAVKQGKAKEDATMISRRKRMLQVFLNRIAKHPLLGKEYVFHRFLDRDASWSEVLHSPPLSQLPKNILKAPPHNPLDDSNPQTYAALPSPTSSQTLRHPDQRFIDSETFTGKFSNHMGGSMEKVSRRTMKRWSESSHDHAELGAILNGFSLSENGALAGAIEKTGQAIDATYISTARLLQDMEQSWTEPLHEYAQFAEIIKKLLAYRHQKHVQYEMTQELLAVKREQLEELEKSEAEAKRLESALGRSTIGPSSTDENGEENGGNGTVASPVAYAAPLPPSVSQARRRNGSTGMGFLSALSHSIQGIMDVDPESTRRSNISKTRDTISQLEDALKASSQDLKYASTTIQADLDRFQRQKVADIREMCISMAKIHRDWCKQNLEAWEEAKKEIDKIEDHPNRPPPSTPTGPTTTATTGE